MNKQFLYGADGRWAVGFGFWQWTWGSKQTLDATHYATARAALSSMKGDYGRPIGIMPDLLVVPPSLESAGRKLLNSEYWRLGRRDQRVEGHRRAARRSLAGLIGRQLSTCRHHPNDAGRVFEKQPPRGSFSQRPENED
jgi:hypothetical protein